MNVRIRNHDPVDETISTEFLMRIYERPSYLGITRTEESSDFKD